MKMMITKTEKNDGTRTDTIQQELHERKERDVVCSSERRIEKS